MENSTKKFKKLLFIFSLFFLAEFVHAQDNTTTFNADGTFTVPAGYTYNATIHVWGAGGRGGSRSGSNGAGGGGGGGAYSSSTIVLTAGTYSVTVGTGATTSTADGEDSSFSTLVIAKGGKTVALNSATGGAGGQASAGTGTTKYSGGTGVNGLAAAYSGGGGASAGTANNGATGVTATGGIALNGGGNGGAGRLAAAGNGNGTAGSAPGGGGGGALRISNSGADPRNGGAGANGRVIVTWNNPEINIQGNGNNIASGDNSPTTTDNTNFGTVDYFSGTISKTFTIQNSGAGLLGIGNITFSGTGAADFSVTTQPTLPVAASGGSTTFTVTFNPSTVGTRTAIISIPNNDASENPYTFTITGNGGTPSMTISGNGSVITDGDNSPSVSDFTNLGAQYIFSGSLTRTYTVKNTGTATVTLGAITIGGTNAVEFSSTNPAATVAPGVEVTFNITFNPSGAGSRVGTFSIVTNVAGAFNPYNFSIAGTGNTYLDSDGDGITDNNDLDDDNDGVSDTSEEAICRSVSSLTAATTFLNEDFGTGTTRVQISETTPSASTNYTYESGQTLYDDEYTVYYKIAGTNQADPTNISDFSWYAWVKSEDHTPGDTNGRMAVFNASNNAGVFYENTINGILPNIEVSYSFWVMNVDNADSAFSAGELPRKTPTIKVEFIDTSTNSVISGTTYTTPAITRCASGNSCTTSIWKNFTTTANLGSRTSFKIRLTNTSPGGFGNDLAMDDIVISQKYCDLEGDGDADIFDLDDDNDGIPDIVEAGYGTYSSGKSTMDIGNSSKWIDANTNGVNDLVVTTPLDSDGDLIYDFMDLDSDNDGIFDIDEAQKDTFYTGGANAKYNGDADIDGDGTDDSAADSDGDGIQDLNDEDPTVFGTGVSDSTKRKAFPTDTDSDGAADYRDLRSNGSTYDIATTLYASFDANNDGKVDGTTDVDKDGIRDAIDSNTSTTNGEGYGSPRNFTDKKLLIDFDGRNDYGEGPALISNLSSATIMGWIKLDEYFSGNGVVFGNSNLYLSVGSDKKLSAATPNVSTTFNTTALDVKRWYHVAASYSSSGNLLLYLNGKLVSSVAASGTLATTTSKFTIAKTSGSLTNFFKGYIDEVRVFNTQLTADQIQKMVYQEIQVSSTKIRGAVLSKDIESTTWASLIGYFRMDDYKNDVIDDYTIAGTDDDKSNAAFTRIYNVKYLKTQNAPLPFKTRQAGILDSTALNDTDNFIYATDVNANDYSIIKVQHDVTLSNNLTGIGLIVDSGKKVTVNNNNKLENSWYLDLQGTIDLVDKSQLVQGPLSDLAPTTTGKIERDQQGTKVKYNYNYWSSPVSTITNSSVNNGYTIAGVMKDGNSGSPVDILWTSSDDAAGGSPVTLSSNWIYKYQNLTNAYASWSYVGETGSLAAGQGYTLKGSNTGSSVQNYIFVGKPNNGTITSPISASNLNLSGNPYPSALSASEFIKDNLPASSPSANPGTSGALTGSLYFWQHSPTNNSHIYASYIGGYGVYSLVGGVSPVSAPSGTSGQIGSSNTTPGDYIPVGQGFFVQGSTTGGNITFKNSQRAFVKENASNSSALMRNANATQSEENNNQDTPLASTIQEFIKIRIGFNNNVNSHRQVLIGFMNENATDGFDLGYDALNFDTNPSDMYFKTPDSNLIVQGVGSFSEANIYPLGVSSDTASPVSFTLDGVENLDENQDIYIYDAVDNSYHNIREGIFETTLDEGTFEERFSLRFSNPLSVTNPVAEDKINVAYTTTDQMLVIKNKLISTTVESAILFNVLGQQVSVWNVENENQENIQIPVRNISAGTYIVKVKTTTGSVSKKIIIR